MRNLKPHITLYLEKEVPVSTETLSDLLLGLTFETEFTQKQKWEEDQGTDGIYLEAKDLRPKKDTLFFFALDLLEGLDTENFIARYWTIFDKWCQTLQHYLTVH